MERHSLLRRQLKRHFGGLEAVPDEWQEFLDRVDRAYREFDRDREMLERAMELSSEELMQANSQLRGLLQAFPDLVFRVTGDGTILDVRTGSEEDLLLSPAQLSGRRLQEIPAPPPTCSCVARCRWRW